MSLKVDKRYVRRYAPAALLCVIVLLWASWYASAQTITGFELHVFRYVNGWPGSLRLIFLLITQLGSAWMLFVVTLLLLWKKYNRLALRVLFGGVVAYLATEFMKKLVARPRPFYLLANVNVHEYIATGYGFPSGHTAIATTVTLFLIVLLPKRWRWLPLLWIALVGLSRVYLGVHAPLDIVGGCMIGCLVFISSQIIKNKLKTTVDATNLSISK